MINIRAYELPYPLSNNRYYRNYRGITCLSKEATIYKKIVKVKYERSCKLSGELFMIILIHPKMTKSGEPYKIGLDTDNCAKGILDSLIGVAYEDDKQIRPLFIDFTSPIINGGCKVIIGNRNEFKLVYNDLEY